MSYPEWPKQPPAEPSRPDLDELFGPHSRFTPYSTPSGPEADPPLPPTPKPKLNPLLVLAFVLGGVVTVLGLAAAAAFGKVLLSGVPGFDGPTPAIAAPAAPPPAAAPPSSYSADALARDLSWQLTHSGNTVRNVTCPRDLERVLATTVRCAAVYGDGQPVDIVVTVTSVDGETIGYEWRPEARTLTRSRLEPKVSDLIAQRMGTRPLSTSCAGDLLPVVGSRVDCTVNLAGRAVPMVVTTTGTGGGLLSISIAQK